MGKLKNMLPFLMVIALNYYFVPSMMFLLVVIPIFCLGLAIIYGTNNSFSILFAVFVSILFLPLVLTIYAPLAIFFAVGFGIITLIGTAIGMIFYKRNIRISLPKNFNRDLIIAVVGIYLMTVITSAIMMGQMKQITHTESAWGITFKECVIDFEMNTAQRNHYTLYEEPRGELRQHEENSISTAEQFKIKLMCSLSLFPLWQKEYYHLSRTDQTYHIIARTYGDMESVLSCYEAYPLTYRLVMMAIENAVR